MNKILMWVWRVVMVGFVLALIPLSVWYLICAISTLDYKGHVSNALPIPFVPELLAAALGLVFMTWGMVALWWLVFNHERVSFREIGHPWRIGLIGGTSIAVYWLIKLSASSVALPKKVTREFAFSGCDTSSGKVGRCGYTGGCRS